VPLCLLGSHTGASPALPEPIEPDRPPAYSRVDVLPSGGYINTSITARPGDESTLQGTGTEMGTNVLELVIPPTNGPVVQRLSRPSGIRETRGSSPGLALSFLLPQNAPAPRTQSNSTAEESLHPNEIVGPRPRPLSKMEKALLRRANLSLL